MIPTTGLLQPQTPYAVVEDIAKMKVVSLTQQGAFLDWGLMKDLFVPKSQQRSFMRVGGEYLRGCTSISKRAVWQL